jgi:hypothetical protein
MEEDYLGRSLKKLEEIGKKTELKNTATKKELDTKSNERHFARREKRKDHTNNIGIILMYVGGFALVAFICLVFLAGINPKLLPESSGVTALEELFVLVVKNSKIIILIIVGYFFRDYASEMYGRVKEENKN